MSFDNGSVAGQIHARTRIPFLAMALNGRIGSIVAVAIVFSWMMTTPAAAETITSYEVLCNSVTIYPTDPETPGAIVAKFTPNSGLTLDEAAADCGVDHFNWLQTIVGLPAGWSAEKIIRSNEQVVGNLSTPIFDPLENSVDYAMQIITPAGTKQVAPLAAGFFDKNSCYYGEDWSTWWQPGNLHGTPQVAFSKALLFYDSPSRPDDVSGPDVSISYLTQLVGVKADGTIVSFDAPGTIFAWTTNAAHDSDVHPEFILAMIPGGPTLPPVVSGGISNVHLVSEPSCTAFLCVGFACLFISAWRRRKHRA